MFIVTSFGLAFASLLGLLFPFLSQTVLGIPEELSSGYNRHHARGDNITSELSTYIREMMDTFNITGLVAGIVPKDGVPDLKAWGYISENGEETTPDTLFYMASVSKPFCATALGILIDDFTNGRNVTALPSGLTEISWRTRVADLLPGEWELMDKWASEKATLKDILAHVSGVPRHDFAMAPSDTTLDVIKRLKYLKPAFELRERSSYNNIMYGVSAYIVAKYANQTYTSFVEERIFTPLNMTYSTFSSSRAEASGKLSQGWSPEGRLIPEGYTPNVTRLAAGPGGVISNAIDMSKWLAAWLNRGVYEGKTVIPLSVYQNTTYSYSIYEDHPVDGDSVSGYGRGWWRRSHHGHDIVEHSGSLPGFSTWVSFLPSHGLGVLVFANCGGQEDVALAIVNRTIDSVTHNQSPSRRSHQPVSRRSTKIGAVERDMALSLNDLAGTYTNSGYGTFTLCSLGSNSSYCSQVHAEFAMVDTAEGNPDSSLQLLAAWPRVWASHMRMEYVGGASFTLTMPTLFPYGYGEDSTPFENLVMGAAEAEFVVDNGTVVGFGVTGFVGVVREFWDSGSTVQDRSEVWFHRI